MFTKLDSQSLCIYLELLSMKCVEKSITLHIRGADVKEIPEIKMKTRHFDSKIIKRGREVRDFEPSISYSLQGGKKHMRCEQSWPGLHLFPCCIFAQGVDNHIKKGSAVFEGNRYVVGVMSIQQGSHK